MYLMGLIKRQGKLVIRRLACSVICLYADAAAFNPLDEQFFRSLINSEDWKAGGGGPLNRHRMATVCCDTLLMEGLEVNCRDIER